jgi:hypothetical protein
MGREEFVHVSEMKGKTRRGPAFFRLISHDGALTECFSARLSDIGTANVAENSAIS